MPTTEKYYPALSDLISINEVPSALHFLKDGWRAKNLLNQIKIINLKYSLT